MSSVSAAGFCVDLLDWMSQGMGFRYDLYHVADNNWGAKDPITGKWNGVVADVAYKKADMVVASITIRADREEVVDFTTPYIDVGLTFVMSKVGRKEISLFNFFGPLEKRLWLLIAITTVAVGVFLSIVNKLSPYSCRPVAVTRPGQDNHEREPSLKQNEKTGKDDDDDDGNDSDDDENDQTKITLGDWIWNSFCTLFQQGPEEYPKSAAGRFTAGVWWLVILILIATYTANLAAHLTIGRLQETIGSVEDLAKQTEIAYGTVLSSGPHSFFLQSTIETFQKMARYMSTHDVMVATSEEGIARARRGHYAFVWDSGILDYVTKTPPCDLKTVGRLFSKTGYGFALQKNSPYTKEFTEKILWARESGKLEELFNKWTGGSECAREDAKLSTIVIGLDHMLGVFVLVYGAMAISLVVLTLEWILVCVGDVDKKSAKKPQTMPEAFLGRFKSLKQKLFGDADPLARFRLPQRRRTPVPAKEEYECNTQATS
ncbi:glutamate receptor 2-like [Branchiostoma floridae]|uniref:Glutamate receptor 2-like n=1 Tax=Branchiostoma floridae TaxID=7739 RepID=A0A9J7LD68_BRAFL|nr:glutamate receptor 2-like [Branchiostoma floridae]